MTARYLMTLALSLGMSGVVGCSGGTTTKDTTVGDDDDTTAGDDDDDSTSATGDTGAGGSNEMVPAQMTMWAQFSTVGGSVIDSISEGQSTYYSILVVNIGPSDWDPNNQNDYNYCSIIAPLATSTLGALDAEPVVAPYADAGDAPAAETDCYDYFTLPVGFDPTTLVTAVPGWSVGVATALTPDMQTTLDQIPAEYQDFFMGGYWNIPLLKEPIWETVYTVGNAIEGGTTVGAELVRNDVAGQAELPDGIYYTDALLILDISGIFQ